jgi:hypothetical protein
LNPNRPHPNPLRAAKGQTILLPGDPASPRFDVQQSSRKPLIDDLPEIREISFGFSQIDGPAQAATITAHEDAAAWYRLGRLDWDLINQDVFLNKISVEMLSADVAGSAAGSATPPETPAAWGDIYGGGAYIVVTENLRAGSLDNGWMVRPLDKPGMRVGGLPWASPDAANTDRPLSRPIIASFGWTIGSMADPQPYKQEKTKSFGVFGKRVGRSDAIEVWFVVRPGTLLLTTVALYGHCDVNLYVGLTRESGTSRD